MNEVNDNEEQFVEVKTREINSNIYNYFIAFACFSWSVFQLYIAYFPLNTNISRSIHLAFAVGLVFLLYPVTFHKKAHSSLPFYDLVFCVVGVVAVLYPAVYFY